MENTKVFFIRDRSFAKAKQWLGRLKHYIIKVKKDTNQARQENDTLFSIYLETLVTQINSLIIFIVNEPLTKVSKKLNSKQYFQSRRKGHKVDALAHED